MGGGACARHVFLLILMHIKNRCLLELLPLLEACGPERLLSPPTSSSLTEVAFPLEVSVSIKSTHKMPRNHRHIEQTHTHTSTHTHTQLADTDLCLLDFMGAPCLGLSLSLSCGYSVFGIVH